MDYIVDKAISKAKKWWGEKQAAREAGGQGGAGPSAAEKYQSRMAAMQQQVNETAAKSSQ